MNSKRTAAKHCNAKATKFNYQKVDYIKHSLTPLAFYRHELPKAKLKKHGWNDGGLCPFHNDNNIGSFRINIETGAFKCFSCGEAGGDVVAFTMTLHGLRFSEALSQLVRDWGL